MFRLLARYYFYAHGNASKWTLLALNEAGKNVIFSIKPL